MKCVTQQALIVERFIIKQSSLVFKELPELKTTYFVNGT
jgi:hypothetical protein